jgi:predicted nucleic acid-binding protein
MGNMRLCLFVVVPVTVNSSRPSAKDPDDDFLIDLAVVSQSQFIVTFNKKDLQAAQNFGMQLLKPKEFLQYAGVVPCKELNVKIPNPYLRAFCFFGSTAESAH